MYADRQMTLLALVLYAVAFAILFGAWFALVQSPPVDAEQGKTMIQWIIASLGLLAGHVFTILPAGPSDVTRPSPQGGFATLRELLLVAFLAACALFALGGCTTTTAALYAGYASAADKGVKAADDNIIGTWRALACATPLSAALRNPEIIPGLKALCLPGGNASDPSGLLDARAPITINLTLPASAASAAK